MENTKEDNLLVIPGISPKAPMNESESQMLLALVREDYIEQFLDHLGSIIFSQVCTAGVDGTNKDLIPDFTMIHEALRSLMLKHYGMRHPIQAIAHSIYAPENDDKVVRVNIKADEKETHTVEFVP